MALSVAGTTAVCEPNADQTFPTELALLFQPSEPENCAVILLVAVLAEKAPGHSSGGAGLPVKSNVAQLDVAALALGFPNPKGSAVCFKIVKGANGSATGLAVAATAKGSDPNMSTRDTFVEAGSVIGANVSTTGLVAGVGAKGSDAGVDVTKGSGSAVKSIKLIILSELTRLTTGSEAAASPLPE